MSGKTVLVTGSTDSRSIGWNAAKLLASGDHGFSLVILSGRNEDKAKAAAEELQNSLPADSQVKISAVVLDVIDTTSIKNLAIQLQSDGGLLSPYGGRLDVLVNNAGVGVPPGRVDFNVNMFLPTQDTTADDIMYVMKANVAAVVELTNQLLPALSLSAAPRVVNVSSARGSLSFAEGLPAERTGALVYNASKTALNMVTLMQSKNLPSIAPGIKVNAASPGHVKTTFNNFTGIRTLEQGVGVIVHLATLPEDGPTGQLMGDHAPFSDEDGKFVKIPW
ncbi:hypothetical protein DL96DRAFT_1585536 [Flagelloscypha sp. PMI_526]|nr:hypothetical protein DL96DRAFT_1585536 [Flagelloscypha sp. PMI_526]